MEGGVPGGVEDGPIPAEADQQVRLGEFLLQLVEGCLTGQLQPLPLLGDEGQTQHRLRTGLPQDPVRLQRGPKPPVPIGVRA